MKQDLLNVISYLSTVIGTLEVRRKRPPTDAETAVMRQLLIARENIRRVYVTLPGAIQVDEQGNVRIIDEQYAGDPRGGEG